MTSIPGKEADRTNRMRDWVENNVLLDKKQFLADIEFISKGRFAQRLVTAIQKSETKKCPAYVTAGLSYLWHRLHPKPEKE